MILKRISGFTIVSLTTNAIAFCFLPVITKYLTPEDYGFLSIFNASISLLVAIFPLGINHTLNVELVTSKKKYFEKLEVFFKIIFFNTLIVAGLFVFLDFFSLNFFGLPEKFTFLIPFFAFFTIIHELVLNYYIYLKKFAKYVKLIFLKFFIEYFSILIFVVIFPFAWKGRILALGIGLVMSLFLLLNTIRTKYVFLSGFKNSIIDLPSIKKSLPLALMGISIMVMNLSDRFFIEKIEGLKATGLYGIASTIAGIFLLVIGSSMNVIRPIIYEKLKFGNNRLTNLTIGYILGMFSFGVFFVSIVPLIFYYLINISFSEAVNYTIPLIIGLFFWGIFNYTVSFFLFKKKNKIVGIVSFFGVLINLGFNYIFISYFGTIGAAYSTLLTYFLMSLIICLLYYLN